MVGNQSRRKRLWCKI